MSNSMPFLCQKQDNPFTVPEVKYFSKFHCGFALQSIADCLFRDLPFGVRNFIRCLLSD